MSLTNTMMQPLIGMYQKNRLDRWETLFSRYGVYGAFRSETDNELCILSPENKKKLYYSWGNTVPIVVMDGDDPVVGSTYSCSIADYVSTTTKVIPTFTQIAWGFNQYPAEYAVGGQALNYVEMQDDFTKKSERWLKSVMTLVDTTSRNILETNKNTYWATNIANYFPVVGDALQISQAMKNDAFNQLAAVLEELDLYDKSLIISSTSLKPLTTRLEAQGEGNAYNERFQFLLGNFIFTNSNRVTNGAGVQSTAYMCQPGSIAVFNRNAPDFITNAMIGAGPNPVTAWSTMQLPMLDMEVATFYSNVCASEPSATSYLRNTLYATIKNGFGWNTEIGWLTPYNSDPANKVTPIVKMEISNS